MCELFSARRTLHPLEIDPLHLGGFDDLPAFRADRIEGRLQLFELDFPAADHPGILARCDM
ncbi:MAG TPA: hypothetical protein VN950_01130 [Terriglobales bacterium]|nr:hypothetical protein [Terriglobales bacterium]